MASTFQLWNDTGQTSSFGGVIQSTHESDLSDGSQDGVLYFGSNAASSGPTASKLQTVTNPGSDQISISLVENITDWSTSETVALGVRREPTTPNGFVYEVSTAGDTDASTEPTWPTTVGSTVADNTAVWTCVSAKHETTEIKLATSSAGLTGATAGAALDIGTEVLSGSANQVEIHYRITNTVTDVGTNTSYYDIRFDINSCEEVAQ